MINEPTPMTISGVDVTAMPDNPDELSCGKCYYLLLNCAHVVETISCIDEKCYFIADIKTTNSPEVNQESAT